jgi:hypothetical protein
MLAANGSAADAWDEILNWQAGHLGATSGPPNLRTQPQTPKRPRTRKIPLQSKKPVQPQTAARPETYF